MKILHMWKGDSVSVGAGGGHVMSSLHSNLRKAGIDSRILCEIKTKESPHITVIQPQSRLESLIRRVTLRLGLNDIHRISSFKIKQNKAYLEAHVVHFHGTHSGFISYLAPPSLTKNKHAVFTLHDIWCLTGHCAVNYDCNRWKIGCGKRPYLSAYPPVRRDNTRIEWKLKNWVYARSNLAIVAPSSWLTKQARESMLKCFPIYHIPNGIDTEIYRPFDTKQCRSVLGISPNKKVLMIAATNLNIPHKGSKLLLKSFQTLPKSLKNEIVLLTIGRSGDTIASATDIQTLNLGFVSNDRDKAIAYSAADLFVHPTRSDNLPLVLQESMACGTPMVSFEIGGVPDLVRPGTTGYLAEPENAGDLRNGIVQLLEDEPLRDSMSQQCRAIALKEYSLALQAKRHIALYHQLLQN